MKNIKLDDLSDREYDYFIRLSKDCSKHLLNNNISQDKLVTKITSTGNTLVNIQAKAQRYAAEDAKVSAMGPISLFSSVLFSPLIGGGVCIIVGSLSEGPTTLDENRLREISTLGYDENQMLNFSQAYKKERGDLQRRKNAGAVIMGSMMGLVINLIVLNP